MWKFSSKIMKKYREKGAPNNTVLKWHEAYTLKLLTHSLRPPDTFSTKIVVLTNFCKQNTPWPAERKTLQNRRCQMTGVCQAAVVMIDEIFSVMFSAPIFHCLIVSFVLSWLCCQFNSASVAPRAPCCHCRAVSDRLSVQCCHYRDVSPMLPVLCRHYRSLTTGQQAAPAKCL